MGAAKIGLFRLATILNEKGVITDRELDSIVEGGEIPYQLLSNFYSDRSAIQREKEYNRRLYEEAKAAAGK